VAGRIFSRIYLRNLKKERCLPLSAASEINRARRPIFEALWLGFDFSISLLGA
jgi:hypothetical protein